ncbi:Serine/threonine-protein phosphatase 4 regulatory subunit 4, partial [Rhizophlyctis rosea]
MASDIDWETALGVPSDSIDDDIKGTDELKLSNRLYKTEEEIERFTVDENLGDVDRAIHLLKNGAAIQKSSVITALPSLLEDHNSETRTRVLPTILEAIPSESHDFQVAVGKTLIQLFSKSLLPPKAAMMVVAVAKKMIASRDNETVEIWTDVMIAAIKSLPLETIENEILPEVLLEGRTAQPAALRMRCCRVLGAVSERMEGRRIEELFFRKAMSLCQDTDYEVRACMCNQLNAIARSVGHQLTKNQLLPEYMELLMDEEDMVREAAIENLMKLMDFLDADAKRNMVVPLWRKLCDERPAGVMVLIAREFGGFMWANKDQMTETDARTFLTFYQSMAMSNSPEQREMLTCVGADGYDRNRLNRVLEAMSNDDSKIVRRRIAGGLHEVAAILKPTSYTTLKTVFLRLLSDREVEVFHALIKNLDRILKCFAGRDKEVAFGNLQHRRVENVLTSFPATTVISAPEASPRRPPPTHPTSRTRIDLLEQFENFTEYFDSSVLFDQCVTVLFQLVTAGNLVVPIKEVVIRCLCQFLRRLRRSDYREQVFRLLQDNLKNSPTYHNRLLYIRLLTHSLTQFSTSYFRNNLLPSLLDMTKDPVPNIRLSILHLLPAIRKIIRIPADSDLLHRLTEVLGEFATDTDRDVGRCAEEVFKGFGGTVGGGKGLASRAAAAARCGVGGAHGIGLNVDAIGRGSHSGLPPDAGGMTSAEEMEDRMKEEEEQLILSSEWENEEANKKRDMEEARQEFSRRLAEREV